MLILLAETSDATDYDETLRTVAVALLIVVLIVAFVAAWVVTPAGDH